MVQNDDFPDNRGTGSLYMRTDTIVQGVGDEIIMVICTLLSLFVALAFLLVYSFKRERNRQVHPLAREEVLVVRQSQSATRLGRNGEGDGDSVPQSNGSDRDERERPTGPRNNRERGECPICLFEADEPVETNCGHIFCAGCFVELWTRSSRWPVAVNCPVCRQLVTLLLIVDRVEPETDAARRIGDYNRRMSGAPRPFMDYVHDLPTLARHLFQELFTLRGLFLFWKIRVILLIFVLVVYIISPFDIFSEGVFGLLGLLDDVFVTVFIGFIVLSLYRAAVHNR